MHPSGRIRWGAAATVVAAVLLLVPGQVLAGSPKVAALQAALKVKGLYSAEVDGEAGPMTRAAIMRFQRRHHLTVDGVAGPQTRRALGRRGRPLLGKRALSAPQVGWDVASVQFLLWRRGFSPGAIDGEFGPGTTRAVMAFQRSVGIGADGVVGPQTIRALKSRRTETHPDTSVRFYRPVSGPDGRGLRSRRRQASHRHRLPGAQRHPHQRRPGAAWWCSRAGTPAATETSWWWPTGSASPPGTHTCRGSRSAPGRR